MFNLMEYDRPLINALEAIPRDNWGMLSRIGISLDHRHWDENNSIILDLMQPVIDAWLQHPEFSQELHKFYGDLHLPLTTFHQVPNLIRYFIAHGAAQAIGWYRRVRAVEFCELRICAAVYGIWFRTPKILGNGVTFYDLNSAGSSDNIGVIRASSEISGERRPSEYFPPLIAVLSCGSFKASENHERSRALTTEAWNKLRKTILSLTLSLDGAPVIGTCWTEPLNPDLQAAKRGAFGEDSDAYGGSRNRIPRLVNEETFKRMEKYLSLTGEKSKKLEIAIERLQFARKRSTAGEKAIEVGTGLEALLGDRDSGEISYKLRIRAARYLRVKYEDRAEIFRKIRDLYNLRSKSVHGSNITGNLENNHRIAIAGQAIIEEIIAQIIDNDFDFDFKKLELN